MKYAPYIRQKKSLSSIIISVIFTVLMVPLTFSVGVMFYCNSAFEYYPISGTSMQPLLNPNGINEDCVYVTNDKNHITYNDIIIYVRDLGTEQRTVIKRVVAMAGDNIMIKQTQNNEYAIFIQYGGNGDFVYVEEKFIQNKQVYADMYEEFYNEGSGKEFFDLADGNKYLHIKDDEIFYLGDNRTGSTDCLDYGPQKVDSIIGEVKYIIHKNTNRIWQILLQMFGFYVWK